MIHQVINLTPSLESGLFTLGAAALTGIFSWLGGDQRGKTKGRAEFINAVERAAELVITRLEGEIDRVAQMHRECEDSKTILQARVDLLMSGEVPLYHLNKDKLDG